MDLLSEEEQWERLKAWLRTNGPSVLLLAALLLLGWFGWKWWQQRGETQALAASRMYEELAQAYGAGQFEQGEALSETLRKEHPDSAYVAAADLIAAKLHIQNNELDKAEQRLQRVLDTARDEDLRPIARLRLARVQSAKGQYDAALATLGTAELGLHEPARLEARGDVLLAKGERDAALKEYQAARKLLPEMELQEGGVAELLDLKIADLGGVPVPAADAAAATTTDATPEPAP